MSVPTREVPQAAQDAIRARFNAAAWGQLAERTRDVIIRRMYGMAGVPDTMAGWVVLVGPPLGALPEAQQVRVAETFASSNATTGVAIEMELVLGELQDGGHAQRIRDRAIAIVTHPLDYPAATDANRSWTRDYLTIHLPERCSTLATILHAPEFRNASEDDRMAILDIIDASSPTGLTFLYETMIPTDARWRSDTRISAGTAPLFARDLTGSAAETTLHWLAEIARASELDARVTFTSHDTNLSWSYQIQRSETVRRGRRQVTRVVTETRTAEVHGYDQPYLESEPTWGPVVHRSLALGELVSEIARPNQFLNQDNRGTCAATSIMHRLAVSQPAEYARLAAGLLLRGQSTLSNGDAFAPPDDAFAADDSNRSASERLTQSAMMQYWQAGYRRPRGQPAQYRNVRPAEANNTTGAGQISDGFDGGRDPRRSANDQLRAVQNLFGRRHRLVYVDSYGRRIGAPVITALRQHFAQHPDNPALAALSWVQGGHAIEVLHIDPAGTQAPMVHYWNPWGAAIVVFVDGFPMRVTQSSVEPTGTFFRDHRTRVDPSGATTQYPNRSPRRQTLDDSRAIQRMPVSELQSLIFQFIVPEL